MDLLPQLCLILVSLGLWALVFRGRQRRPGGNQESTGERVRRGTGHALLGLQQFIEPSVEHIFEAENREQKDEDDHDSDGDDPVAIRNDLAASLALTPIDPEEVRRHLAAAQRAGLDWRALYEEAAEHERAERPFKAPSIPPLWRVAPRTVD